MNPELYFTLGVATAGVLSNILYRSMTLKDITITVKDKYKYMTIPANNHVMNNFNIVDMNNTIYNIPYSILALQFDAHEKWIGMQAGKKYAIKTWGVRIPILNIFPKIYNIKEIDTDL
jgi:hypothetical protein